MIFSKLLLVFILTISLSCVAYGQVGTFIIPPGSIATPSFLDSISSYMADKTKPTFSLDKGALGELMWFSEPYDRYVSNKIQSTGYICTENRFIKLESQYDIESKTIDYKTKFTSIDDSGSEFWTDSISVLVVDSTEIIINSQENVIAKIYEAYDIINPSFTQKTIIGDGVNHSYRVSFESGKKYIIVFINDSNIIVCIKRLET